uniref:S-adenosylmethionine-dependent methyltransferase n=1 Tax=Solanum tuberosum TaxID=4113 RepID=M1D401_SOLTU
MYLNAEQHQRTLDWFFLCLLTTICMLQGWVILRDTVPLIELARSHAARLKWDARVIEVESSDEKLLICQKPFSRRQAS